MIDWLLIDDTFYNQIVLLYLDATSWKDEESAQHKMYRLKSWEITRNAKENFANLSVFAGFRGIKMRGEIGINSTWNPWTIITHDNFVTDCVMFLFYLCVTIYCIVLLWFWYPCVEIGFLSSRGVYVCRGYFASIFTTHFNLVLRTAYLVCTLLWSCCNTS